MSSVIVLPLDARPVCYQQVQLLGDIAQASVKLPPKDYFGILKQPADRNAINQWLKKTRQGNEPLIVSLDLLAYGGLIPGRVHYYPLDELMSQVDKLLSELEDGCYGFSSILRIPNYNNAEEEPEYWQAYGETLYRYSELMHQYGRAHHMFLDQIPDTVLKDFVGRRETNFGLNQYYLELLKDKQLNYLTYCQDDTGAYGLNVQEAKSLEESIQALGLQEKAHVQTGADEVASLLLAKVLLEQSKTELKVFPWYFPETGKETMALFDGLPIHQVVERQLQTLGAQLVTNADEADLILFIHCPDGQMGDHCSGKEAKRGTNYLNAFVETIHKWVEHKAVAVADVVFANGADPIFVEAMLRQETELSKLSGFAAWNTPGNTIGTALAMGAITTLAKQQNRFNKESHQQLLAIRFLDDWYYQSIARKNIRQGGLDIERVDLKAEMEPGMLALKPFLPILNQEVTFGFPCCRTFEIEVGLPILAEGVSKATV